MKKIVLALVALVSATYLYADSWLQGAIVEVRDSEKSIVIDTIHSGLILVKVAPTTKIELDDCGWFGNDIFDKGTFKDLKVGRYLEIEGYYPNQITNQVPVNNATNQIPIATKIEVDCRKMAY